MSTLTKIAVIVVFTLAAAGVAGAQEAQQSPLEQALFQRLSGEVQANIQANAKIIELQQQLAAAQDVIRKSPPKPAASAPAAK